MTMAPHLFVPPPRLVRKMESTFQQMRQQEDKLHRGKKGIIEILDIVGEDDDGEFHLHPQERSPSGSNTNTVTNPPPSTGTSSSSTSTSTSTTSRSTRNTPPTVRFLMERILSNPVISYFSCTTPDDDDDGMNNHHKHHIPKSLFGISIDGRFFSSSSTPKQQRHQHQHYYPYTIVHTMKQFPYQGRIQRLGCAALRDWAMDSWSLKCQIIEIQGSIETILKAMRIHGADAKLQEIACECLYRLVAGDLPALLVEKGVVAAILTTMDQHSQDEDVLPIACNVLLALTDRDVGAVECLRQRLGGVLLAKLEHSFRGRNMQITMKVGELLRRLYL